MKKITRATLKSFIKKNHDKLFIKCESSFDGMVDCVMPVADASFVKAQDDDRNEQYSLGVKGLWLVGSSRDYFTAFENDQYIGYEIDNCCGSQTVVIAK